MAKTSQTAQATDMIATLCAKMVGLADDVLTTEPWTREGQDARRHAGYSGSPFGKWNESRRARSSKLTAQSAESSNVDRRSITLRCIRRVGATGFALKGLEPEETRSLNAAYHERIHRDQIQPHPA